MVRESPFLAEIRLHPIKSLDGVSVEQSRIGGGGGLELDRVWALFSADGRCLNGKRTAEMQQIRADFAPVISSVTLSGLGGRRDVAPQEFAFPGDHSSAAEWFSAFLDRAVTVRYVPEGVPDDTVRNGPMIVSTDTLRTASDWFADIDLEESRRRFRTPLEIDGVCAFWEDRHGRGRETGRHGRAAAGPLSEDVPWGAGRRGPQAEAIDLAGSCATMRWILSVGSVTPCVGAAPHYPTFTPGSYWRGETHRISDRPGLIVKLLGSWKASGWSR